MDEMHGLTATRRRKRPTEPTPQQAVEELLVDPAQAVKRTTSGAKLDGTTISSATIADTLTATDRDRDPR